MIFLFGSFTGDNNQETNCSEVAVIPKLNDLIQFICGHPHVPKGGDLIKVKFTRAFLPDAESCFNTIKLPRHHQDYLCFRKAMNVAVNCQNQGYGRG